MVWLDQILVTLLLVRVCRGRRLLHHPLFMLGIVISMVILLLSACGSPPIPPMPPQSSLPGGSPHTTIGSSGAYQTGIPLVVPPYHGLEPNLRLTSDSQGGNGWLGVGWRLSGYSSIVRTSSGKGAPKFDPLDVFYLDGSELLPCTAGMASPSCLPDVALPGLHAYTTRIESFERIARDGSAGPWYVWKKTGTKLTYIARSFEGDRPCSYDVSQICPFAWDLASVEDTLGNRVSYHYWSDKYAPSQGESGESYLDSISYNNGTVVKFYYEPRIDSFTYANGSGLVKVRYRLMTIDITVSGVQVRAYKLSYTAREASTRRSLLYQVQQYGNDVTLDTTGQLTGVAGTILPGGTSLPPITFTPQALENSPVGVWQNQPSSPFTTAPSRTDGARPPSVFNQLKTSIPQVQGGVPWYTGDVNGDGRDDWIQVTLDNNAQTISFLTYMAGGPGNYWSLHWPGGKSANGLKAWAMDLNDDGKTDFLLMTLAPGSPVPLLTAALSLGDGSFSFYRPAIEQSTGWLDFSNLPSAQNFPTNCQADDANGDGKADLICAFVSQAQVQIGTAFSNGDGSFVIPKATEVPFSIDNIVQQTPRIVVGDVNGDGLSDVMWLNTDDCSGGGCPPTLATGISDGSGSYRLTTQTTNWGGRGENSLPDTFM